MSRPHPSYISKDDLNTLNAVRMDIWKNALYGLGVGSLTGGVLHATASQAVKRGLIQQQHMFRANRNTALLSIMLGGSIGSFVCATTTGKNDVHQLHDIFASGSRESRQERANQQQVGVGDLDEALNERALRERNRLLRRASLEESLRSQRGLSDSHGGHWAKDDDPKRM